MNNQNENIKEMVKEKYGEIAKNSGSCCGPASCCGTENKIVGYTVMKDEYDDIDGYVKDADLGLGCGLPTEFAGIKKGNIVVDLGSGAGNDVFVAHALVGNEGKVIGIDMTEEMIDMANRNKKKLGFENVEFYLGEIEAIPLDNSFVDVVVSNCVLNLVPSKQKAFEEIYRILKPGGHFCVSDIVIKGELPANLKKSAEMYAGCVTGAVQYDEYLKIISDSCFENVEVRKTKVIYLPDEILKNYLNDEEITSFRKSQIGILSITVTADKN